MLNILAWLLRIAARRQGFFSGAGRWWLAGLWLALLGSRPVQAQTWELLARLESTPQNWSGMVSPAVAPNGDIVVSGGTYGRSRLGPLGLGTTGLTDVFVARRSAQSGQWQWAATAIGPAGMGIGQVLVLPNNDVLVLGTFQDGYAGATFGNLPTLFGEGTYDGYVGCINGASGQWRWVAQLATRGGFAHAQPRAMALRPGGDLAVVGVFDSQLQLGTLPLLGAVRPPGNFANNSDLFVARLDPATGRWLQGFSAGGVGSDLATDLVALPDGELALTGTFIPPLALGNLPVLNGSTRIEQAFVARVDPVSEQWRWARQMQSDSLAWGGQLARLPDGDLVVSGRYRGHVQLGQFQLVRNLGITSVLIARLRATDGQWQWATSSGGTQRQYSGGLATTPAGEVVLTHSFEGKAQGGDLPPVSSRSQGPDILVGQLSGRDGRWRWVMTAGSNGGPNPIGTTLADEDYAGDICVVDSQHLLLTGTFTNTAMLGPAIGPLATYFTDGFLARIALPAPCADTLAGQLPPGWQLVFDSLSCTTSRTLRVVGADASATFRWSTGATGPAITVTAAGTYSVQITTAAGCRYSVTYQVVAGSLPVVALLPNIITPNADGDNDYWVVPGLQAGSELRVFNRWGRLVYQTASYDNRWNAAGLAAGLYYYTLQPARPCPAAAVKGWIEVVR